MTLDTARESIGKEVAFFQDHRPVSYGVITGVGTKALPLVYVRMQGKKYSQGFAPDLLELADTLPLT